MKSLFINSTEKNLVVCFKNNKDIKKYESDGTKSQNEEIFTAIEKILGNTKISELDFMVIIGGPGSFTGIRLGLSIVKGFAIATNVPVIVISAFQGLVYSANSVYTEDFYVPIFSTGNDIFVSKFDKNGKEIGPQTLIKSDDLTNFQPQLTNTQIIPEKVLEMVEVSFSKETFKQEPITPIYIKPHYAKPKSKNV